MIKATRADAYKLFHEGTLAFATLEANGIPIDLDYLTKAQREVKQKIKELDEKLYADPVWELWIKTFGQKAKISSHPQLGEILFRKMEYPITMWTEGGAGGKMQPSTDEKHLATVDLPFVRTFLQKAKLDKVLNTYLIGIAREVDSEGLLHPVFSLAGGSGTDQEKGGAKSYRSCVAKGTLIEVIRDVSKYPNGIPIEDVKVGDYVLCYNDLLTLSVRKVIWAGKTGRRKVVRLHWKSQKGKMKGYLDVTPDHLIRMVDGSYLRADEIISIDGKTIGGLKKAGLSRRTLAVTRTTRRIRKKGEKTVNSLTRTGSQVGVSEARLVWKAIHGPIPRKHIIVHKDRNVLNNTPDNLACIHKAEDYLLRFVLGPRFRKWTEEELAEIDAKEEEKKAKKEAEKAAREAERKAGIDKSNHTITRIEYLEEEVDVYDLDVEDAHNFIANEICVHNSSRSPNFQNMPIRSKTQGEYIRRCIIPGDGNVMLEVDFGGIEVKLSACYNKDPTLIKYIEDPTTDMHRDQASECYLLDFSGWKKSDFKDIRYVAKNQFVFPEFYGSVAFQCAPAMWRSIDTMKLCLPDGTSLYKHLESKGITSLGHCNTKKTPVVGTFYHHVLQVEKDFWGRRFPVYAKWKEDWWNAYRKNFYFDLLTGFRIEGIYEKNKVINLPIQGAAFHCLLWSIIELLKYLKEHKCKTKIVGQIHDSMILIGPRSEIENLLPVIRDIMTVKIREAWRWLIVPLEIEADMVDEGSSWHFKHAIKI